MKKAGARKGKATAGPDTKSDEEQSVGQIPNFIPDSQPSQPAPISPSKAPAQKTAEEAYEIKMPTNATTVSAAYDAQKIPPDFGVAVVHAVLGR